ncbi:MAG: endonuclease/exonuclease/phosphatase family protein [Planctomycetota bacterium]
MARIGRLGGLTVLVGLLTGCAAPAPFRVMSFNIRTADADDGVNAWPPRREVVVATIQAHAPDILGLQEVLASQGDELRAALPDYGFVGVGRDDGQQAGEFVPILYRRQRLTLLEAGHFWLSDQPTQPGSVGWDAALPRMATWARLRCNDAPWHEIHVVNTHLDHRGAQARLESARLLRRLVESLGGLPILLLGDFNCPPGSAPYRVLTAGRGDLAELSDAHAAAGNVGTYHAFTGQPGVGRIDWILVNRRLRTLTADVDRAQRDGRYPSDHFPVVAEISFVAGRGGG